MSLMVSFQTATGVYAVPVEHALGVRTARDLAPLASARPGVEGLLEHAGLPIPVLSVFGGGSHHVLIVDPGRDPFGLLVDRVVGVVNVPAGALGPPPRGQMNELVGGTLRSPEGLVQVVDVSAVARTLAPEERRGPSAKGVPHVEEGGT
jgi:chemotaxis signal transduction protein